jgi:hypothetical protein
MKSAALLKGVYRDCLERGYILVGDNLYPPNHPAAIAHHVARAKRKPRTVHVKTADIYDTRNIKNKQQRDSFTMLMEKEGLDCWPEYFFSTERLYRLDYAILIPRDSGVLKIGVECDGGTWSKERSGHSSGTGLARDREKATLLATLGWLLIRVTPQELMTTKTIETIKSIINQKL